MGEFNNMSDVDALLSAAYKPEPNAQPVLTMPLPVTEPQRPVPGGAIGTTDTPAAPAPVFSGDALIWVGAGIGTALLLTGGMGKVNGAKKNKWLVPALIGGAALAYYFFGDKLGLGTGGGSSVTDTETDANRLSLQTRYASDPSYLAVVNSASPGDLRIWATLVQIWNTNQDPYALDINGARTTNRPSSIGAWWEGFTAKNNLK